MAGWTKMPLGMMVGLGPGDLCLKGTQLPQKKGHSPTQFLAHVYCDQTAGWIKMPLGTEVNVSPGNVVLDGVRAPPPKRGTATQFSVHVYSGQTVQWIKTPLSTEVDLGPGDSVLDGNPVPPSKGAQQPPLLSAMSIVETVTHLSYCWALVARLTANCPYTLQSAAALPPQNWPYALGDLDPI